MGRTKKINRVSEISTTNLKKEKVMDKEFKSGDNVVFTCCERETSGIVDGEIGNGVYRVKCGTSYVAVMGSQLSLESKEEEVKTPSKKYPDVTDAPEDGIVDAKN
jgi:hypothetical protein